MSASHRPRSGPAAARRVLNVGGNSKPAEVLAKDLDIDDVLYESPAGPITVGDVVYGFDRKIAETGRDFYAHRSGFMHRALLGLPPPAPHNPS